MRDDYATNVKPKIDALASTVSTLISQTDSMITQLSGTADGLDDVTGDVGTNVTSIRSTLGAIAKKLDSSAATVKELITKLETGGNAGDGNSDGGDGDNDADSGESDELRALATANASTLSTLISAPVALHRVSVYPIANYGSAMAPFYTILSIWVGAIILCAMLKVTISDREKAHVLGLGDTLPRDRRPVRPGERLTLGTAPRPRVFRTVRDLRTARVAAGHTGLPG